MRRAFAPIMLALLTIAAAAPSAPATAKEKKKPPEDIVITKPVDKSSPTLLKAPIPAGPTPVPYPNTGSSPKRTVR